MCIGPPVAVHAAHLLGALWREIDVSVYDATDASTSSATDLMSVRNSARVLSERRKAPSIAEVTVLAPGFCTPRIVMQWWLYD